MAEEFLRSGFRCGKFNGEALFSSVDRSFFCESPTSKDEIISDRKSVIYLLFGPLRRSPTNSYASYKSFYLTNLKYPSKTHLIGPKVSLPSQTTVAINQKLGSPTKVNLLRTNDIEQEKRGACVRQTESHAFEGVHDATKEEEEREEEV